MIYAQERMYGAVNCYLPPWPEWRHSSFLNDRFGTALGEGWWCHMGQVFILYFNMKKGERNLEYRGFSGVDVGGEGKVWYTYRTFKGLREIKLKEAEIESFFMEMIL